jgi:RNA polymerase sigma-32 factor
MMQVSKENVMKTAISNAPDLQRAFVKAAMAAPYLEKDEEQNLARKWRDDHDEASLHRLTSAHMRLVISVASRFRHYGLNLADLIQEGHIGLLEAAARFEPERDIRFSTYATWWIRASIQDYVLRNWSIVRGGTSSAQKALFFNLRRLRAKLMRDGQDRMSEEIYQSIADSLGVPIRDVAVMDARLSGPDASLNAPASEEDSGSTEKMDFLVDETDLPDERVQKTLDGEKRMRWLKGALSVLSEREMRVIRERRLQDKQETLESLGLQMGISKERVRQIENKAFEKVKKALLDHHPEAAKVFM